MGSFMTFIKKHWKPLSVAAADILLLPMILVCRAITEYMIAQNNICDWTRIGALCGTCGGTRCVYSITNGNLAQAFELNQFVFICAVYLLITLVMLHFAWVFNLKFANIALKWMYSIPALIVASVGFVAFIIIRNIHFIEKLFELLTK